MDAGREPVAVTTSRDGSMNSPVALSLALLHDSSSDRLR